MLRTTDIEGPKKKRTDPRLRSEKFKRKVRLVMESLGIQNTMSNFKKYDKVIDWVKSADTIQNPKHLIEVTPIWNGEPVKRRPYLLEIPAMSRKEAEAKLNPEHYKISK